MNVVGATATAPRVVCVRGFCTNESVGMKEITVQYTTLHLIRSTNELCLLYRPNRIVCLL